MWDERVAWADEPDNEKKSKDEGDDLSKRAGGEWGSAMKSLNFVYKFNGVALMRVCGGVKWKYFGIVIEVFIRYNK